LPPDEVVLEGAWDARRATGVSRVHELEVQVWRRRDAGVADAAEELARFDLLTGPNRDAPRREMGVQRVGPAASHDHVIAGDAGHVLVSPADESTDPPERPPHLANGLDPARLGHAVGGRHHLARDNGVDGLAPRIAALGAAADEIPAEGARWVDVATTSLVDANEVVGEPLTEQVGAVARNAIRG
jgi:hypothetical protein